MDDADVLIKLIDLTIGRSAADELRDLLAIARAAPDAQTWNTATRNFRDRYRVLVKQNLREFIPPPILVLPDINWSDSFSIGRPSPRITETADLYQKMKQEIIPGNLRAENGDDPHVALNVKNPQTGQFALLAPLGNLLWTQRLAPLNLELERLRQCSAGRTQQRHCHRSRPGSKRTARTVQPGHVPQPQRCRDASGPECACRGSFKRRQRAGTCYSARLGNAPRLILVGRATPAAAGNSPRPLG